MTEPVKAQEPNENPLLSLILNIIVPSAILMKLSAETRLGPIKALIFALGFPIGYGLWNFRSRHKVSFFSILGFISILLTGCISLMKLGNHWIAIKEATIPLMIGIAIIGSLRTKAPLVRTMLYNEKVIDVPKVELALKERGNEDKFERLLIHASYLLSLSFFLSAFLNYSLAKYLIVSEPGTVAFNEELGKMTAWSYPVIVVPSMLVLMVALWRLTSGIRHLTGLDFDAVFKSK